MSNHGSDRGLRWLLLIGVYLIVIAAFYMLDYAALSLQGLPLNLDLTPAQ